MKLGKHTKQPVEVKDYVLDWSDWLRESSDSLDDVSATVVCVSREDDPLASTLNLDRVVLSPELGQASVWLSRGTDGESYQVSVTATTVGGRVDQSEFAIKIKEV